MAIDINISTNMASLNAVSDLSMATAPDYSINYAMSPKASIILESILLVVFTIIMGVILYLLMSRKEIQPLKIRSPKLLILCVLGNTLMIIMLLLIQIQRELC